MMAISMEPILALSITLPAPGSRHLLRDLHRQLQSAIIDGRLRAGLRLPPTRNLAAALGISRNTTVAAYDLLLSEGYLVARPGAGTYVADALSRRVARQAAPDVAARPATERPQPDRRLVSFWRDNPPVFDARRGPPMRFDFQLGLPDRSQFPQHLWRRLATRSLQQFGRASVRYDNPAGSPELRAAIARHVAFTRAVACEADDIIVTAGAQQAFDLLARILVTPQATTVALEDPGYPPLRYVMAAAGARLVGVPVDDEGLQVTAIPKAASIICVTPSHQFPLGAVLSLRRRSALLDLARSRNAVIIEDDYDSEFRFDGQPLDALQTLDRHGLVFYVGTFSKSLFPELRIGYVVAPAWARPALMAAKQLVDWHNPLLLQNTLAAFIADGHLARHVRKMRRVYAGRRAQLLEALTRFGGERLQPIPAMAGLHLAARLSGRPAAVSEPADQRIATAARALGLRCDSASRYRLTAGRGVARDAGALVFGYGQIEQAAIAPAIKRLAKLL
jgi:GntR family transcriptional regulator/MocR family aminotransferase